MATLRAWCEAKYWEDAENELNRLVGEGQIDAEETLRWRVRIAVGRGDHENALRLFENSPGLKRRSPGLFAQTLIAAGRPKEAASILESLGSEVVTEDMSTAYAELALREGRLVEALDAIETSNLANDGPWLVRSARILEQLGEPGEAWAAMRKALNVSSSCDRDLLVETAGMAERAGQLGMARGLREIADSLEAEPAVVSSPVRQLIPVPTLSSTRRRSPVGDFAASNEADETSRQ